MSRLAFFLLTLAAGAALLPATPAAVPVYTDYSSLNSAADKEKAYRERVFRAYLPIEEVSKRLRVSGYSRFENPTGIFFTQGESGAVTLQGKPRVPVKLLFRSFVDDTEGEVPLHEGENPFTAPCSGLAYLSYYDAEPDTAPVLTLNIQGGKVNGVFTQHDTNATWKELVDKASAKELDLLGERCHFVFDVAALRKGNRRNGWSLMQLLDDLIRWQQELMGWDKYGTHPGNHIFGRAVSGGYMYMDPLGAAFCVDTTPGLCNPRELCRSGAWGVSHEFGHVNQINPGLDWVGITEVSNNIFSSWGNYKLNHRRMRLEHEIITAWNGREMRGGRFDCYINNAVVRKQLWQLQGGPDSGGPDAVPTDGGDSFVTLAPLWQLQLYMAVALGKTDFYADIQHSTVSSDSESLTQGMQRIQFMRHACDAAGLDLSAFFVKTGMLAPINRRMEDYTPRMLTVTPQMVEDTLHYAARYPQPESSVIHYINANNVEIFRDKRPVVPDPAFRPALRDGCFVMPAYRWKNAVAFECYEGDKLVRVCLRGLGRDNNASTTVICPSGTTCVKAVQWDGARYTVCTFGSNTGRM